MELLSHLIFPLGFFMFSVRLILDLMGVELHFRRWERAALSLIFATICIGFTLANYPTWDNAMWHTLTKMFFGLVIIIMGNKTVRVMIKLHYPRP
jgi:hypothetical protein